MFPRAWRAAGGLIMSLNPIHDRQRETGVRHYGGPGGRCGETDYATFASPIPLRPPHSMSGSAASASLRRRDHGGEGRQGAAELVSRDLPGFTAGLHAVPRGTARTRGHCSDEHVHKHERGSEAHLVTLAAQASPALRASYPAEPS
jgi:hypothetical protein